MDLELAKSKLGLKGDDYLDLFFLWKRHQVQKYLLVNFPDKIIREIVYGEYFHIKQRVIKGVAFDAIVEMILQALTRWMKYQEGKHPRINISICYFTGTREEGRARREVGEYPLEDFLFEPLDFESIDNSIRIANEGDKTITFKIYASGIKKTWGATENNNSLPRLVTEAKKYLIKLT